MSDSIILLRHFIHKSALSRNVIHQNLKFAKTFDFVKLPSDALFFARICLLARRYISLNFLHSSVILTRPVRYSFAVIKISRREEGNAMLANTAAGDRGWPPTLSSPRLVTTAAGTVGVLPPC